MARSNQSSKAGLIEFVVYEKIGFTNWCNPDAIKAIRLYPEGCLPVIDERIEDEGLDRNDASVRQCGTI